MLTTFPDKLRLKERAEEDSYFARRDRELIAALRRRRRTSLIEVRSGGQTGVDRGALDAVLALPEAAGIVAGGWCPRGRLAEDGVLGGRYPLRETPDSDSAQRTEWNVRDADATLILRQGEATGGTALTARMAERLGKPLRQVDLDRPPPIDEIRSWLQQCDVRVLNVAGPRESDCPGIGNQSRRFVACLLRACIDDKELTPT